jgi:hypothetical protein
LCQDDDRCGCESQNEDEECGTKHKDLSSQCNELYTSGLNNEASKRVTGQSCAFCNFCSARIATLQEYEASIKVCNKSQSSVIGVKLQMKKICWVTEQLIGVNG